MYMGIRKTVNTSSGFSQVGEGPFWPFGGIPTTRKMDTKAVCECQS